MTNYPSFVVIVVDNALSNDSLSTLARFNDNRIRIVESKTNLGFAEGNISTSTIPKGHTLYFLTMTRKFLLTEAAIVQAVALYR